jgi:hypothetical protein
MLLHFWRDLHLDEQSILQIFYDVEEGLQFIPMPAKYDINAMDKRTKAFHLKEVTSVRHFINKKVK